MDFSLPAPRVIRALDQIIEWRGKPEALRCDNGPEYISQALVAWANQQRITLMYIQPGKPTQNAYRTLQSHGTARVARFTFLCFVGSRAEFSHTMALAIQ
ncbi:integrase, catalytic region [gamma proteobacterium NOR5-3]|nr:integrase, catalytic region [gamma proteobacterium NOR5-3]